MNLRIYLAVLKAILTFLLFIAGSSGLHVIFWGELGISGRGPGSLLENCKSAGPHGGGSNRKQQHSGNTLKTSFVEDPPRSSSFVSVFLNIR